VYRANWTNKVDIEATRTHAIDNKSLRIGSRITIRTTIVADNRVDDVEEEYVGHNRGL
jgi:hypothetical protein